MAAVPARQGGAVGPDGDHEALTELIAAPSLKVSIVPDVLIVLHHGTSDPTVTIVATTIH
jgi:hypothetical protein